MYHHQISIAFSIETEDAEITSTPLTELLEALRLRVEDIEQKTDYSAFHVEHTRRQ